MDAEHFNGCHPEDEHAPEVVGREPQETEACWHCGTPTPHGCYCADCQQEACYVPPSAVYHCPVCGRWWAYMTGLNITTITFSAEEAAPGG